jgi:hypothetical protein
MGGGPNPFANLLAGGGGGMGGGMGGGGLGGGGFAGATGSNLNNANISDEERNLEIMFPGISALAGSTTHPNTVRIVVHVVGSNVRPVLFGNAGNGGHENVIAHTCGKGTQIVDLKNQLEGKVRFKKEQMRLVWGGTVLEDSKCVREYIDAEVQKEKDSEGSAASSSSPAAEGAAASGSPKNEEDKEKSMDADNKDNNSTSSSSSSKKKTILVGPTGVVTILNLYCIKNAAAGESNPSPTTPPAVQSPTGVQPPVGLGAALANANAAIANANAGNLNL